MFFLLALLCTVASAAPHRNEQWVNVSQPVVVGVNNVTSSDTHYGNPYDGPCLSDEKEITLHNIPGEICSPFCGSSERCPSDKPLGVSADPQCAIKDTLGFKSCGLICSVSLPIMDQLVADSQRGPGASCKPAGDAGICTYDGGTPAPPLPTPTPTPAPTPAPPLPSPTPTPPHSTTISLNQLLHDPDMMCTQFKFVPKPFWMIFVQIVVVQVILAIAECISNMRGSSGDGSSGKKELLLTLFLIYQIVTSLVTIIGIFTNPLSQQYVKAPQAVFTNNFWEHYALFSYMLLSSSVEITGFNLWVKAFISHDSDDASSSHWWNIYLCVGFIILTPGGICCLWVLFGFLAYCWFLPLLCCAPICVGVCMRNAKLREWRDTTAGQPLVPRPSHTRVGSGSGALAKLAISVMGTFLLYFIFLAPGELGIHLFGYMKLENIAFGEFVTKSHYIDVIPDWWNAHSTSAYVNCMEQSLAHDWRHLFNTLAFF